MFKFLAQWTYANCFEITVSIESDFKKTLSPGKKYLDFYHRLIDNFSAYISSFKKIHECDREEFSDSFLLSLAGCLETFTYSLAVV